MEANGGTGSPMCLSWEGVCVQRRLPYCETHSVASETFDKETVNVVMSSADDQRPQSSDKKSSGHQTHLI